MNRYFSSFLITSLLYTSLVASIFYVSDSNPLTKAVKQESKDQNKLQISFVNPVKKVIEEKEIVKKEIKKHIPKKIEKKQKIVKKEIKKTIPKPKKEIVKKEIVKKETKKQISKKIEKKQEVQEVVKNRIKKKEKIVKKETKNTPLASVSKKVEKTKASKIKQNIESKNIKKLQSQYFASLQKKINENKRYPKRAKIRNIQGDVKVEFMISPKGELLSFKIIDGRKLFFKSTKKAIEDCFPFSTPIGVLSKNTTVKLTLAYRLY